MLKVQKEIMHLRNRTQQKEKELSIDVKVRALESSLSWFRDESLKLARIIDDGKRENTSLKIQIESLEKDKDFLSESLKATKRQNRMLKASLENS